MFDQKYMLMFSDEEGTIYDISTPPNLCTYMKTVLRVNIQSFGGGLGRLSE